MIDNHFQTLEETLPRVMEARIIQSECGSNRRG
jgi:hypothetical protein